MKNFIYYAFAGTAIVAMTLTSCKKEDSKSNNNNGGGGGGKTTVLSAGQAIVKAKITGAYSTDYESLPAGSMIKKSDESIFILSNQNPSLNSRKDQFVIELPSNLQTGTHKVSDLEEAGFMFMHTEPSDLIPTAWGTTEDGNPAFNVTVTKLTASEIEGTFSGDLIDEYENTKITAVGSFAGKF